MPTTIYDIKLRYRLEDRATAGARALETSMGRVGRAGGRLTSMFGMLTTAATGFFAVRAAKSWLIDFNVGMEQARIQMAGLLQMNTGGSFNHNMGKSVDLVKRLQERAKYSVGTTQDMVKMASMITRPIAKAGLSMKDLEQITAGAVVSARAFGIEAGMAALDIEQALMGNLQKRDRFARALLEPMGYTTAAFNAMGEKARAQALLKAFNQKAIKDMAKAQATSFAGVTSTLKDNLQIALGKVGLPLMRAMTAEVGKWNEWLTKNQATLSRWAKDFGKTLVAGFRAVKDAISWMVRNRDMLMRLAKAFLVFKAFQFGLGGIANMGAALSSMAGGIGKAGGALKFFNANLGLATTGLAALAAGAKMLADHILDRQEKRIKQKVRTYTTGRAAGATLAPGYSGRKGSFLLAHLRAEGIVEGNELNRKALAKKFGGNVQNYNAYMSGQRGIWEHGGNVDWKYFRASLVEQAFNKARAEEYGASALRTLDFGRQMYQRQKGQEMVLAWNQAADSSTQAGRAVKFLTDTVIANYRRQASALGLSFSKSLMTALRPARTALTDTFMNMARVLGFNVDAPNAKKPEVNVRINRIEVKSDDPDRMAFGLVSAFSDMARNRSQAFHALPEG